MWLYNTIGVIDGGSGDVVIYNTGVSVAGTEERLLLPHEAQLVMAHGIVNFNFCLFLFLSRNRWSFSNDTHNYCGIGHRWGSPHDPGDHADCRQVYLMNEFAQDDTESTHRVRNKHNTYTNLQAFSALLLK